MDLVRLDLDQAKAPFRPGNFIQRRAMGDHSVIREARQPLGDAAARVPITPTRSVWHFLAVGALSATKVLQSIWGVS